MQLIGNHLYDGRSYVPLQPGDVLLYRPSGFFGKAIAVKTWSEVSHVELYMGDGVVWASRDPQRWFPWPSGGGVDFYSFRSSDLVRVRRPNVAPDLERLEWFCAETRGQRYDWWGLARFFNFSKGKQDRMFCSEAVTRALRFAGVELFDQRKDADAVSPGELDNTIALQTLWSFEDPRIAEREKVARFPTGPAFGG
jgi:hypothetical protein